MEKEKLIKELKKIQGMIEGDRFTWENIESLIKKIINSK